jgi:hypothetical protein
MGQHSEIDVLQQDIIMAISPAITFKHSYNNHMSLVTLYVIGQPVEFGCGDNELDATKVLLEKIQSKTESFEF